MRGLFRRDFSKLAAAKLPDKILVRSTVLPGAYRWNAPPERARTFDVVRIAEPSGFGPLGDQPAFLSASAAINRPHGGKRLNREGINPLNGQEFCPAIQRRLTSINPA